MKKILMGLLVVFNLQAQTYEALLADAINNSSELKILQKKEEQISLQGQIERRLKNPSLELEIADFSPNFLTQSNDMGIRVGISQSVLLPHIQRDKSYITKKSINVAKKQYEVEKLKFIYTFNLYYLRYKEAQKKLELQEQSMRLSSEILNVVKQRYEEGAVAKSDYLEAELAYKKTENSQQKLELLVEQLKDELLLFSNLSKRIEIDTEHIFFSYSKTLEHPIIGLSQAQQEVSRSKLELLEHSVESVEFFSELEREPDQDIFRIGISIDLPTFNINNEERQLEKIKIANEVLTLSSKKRRLDLNVQQLKRKNSQLEALKFSHESLTHSQKELFHMYQESYRIAKVNLLKLQKIKEQIVLNQEKILDSNFAIEENNIKINYLQGVYSE
jgi:cobalt-zinc-cadmium efflux system outer membrane protein